MKHIIEHFIKRADFSLTEKHFCKVNSSISIEHFLFICIVKQKQKNFAGCKKSHGFSKFNVNRISFETSC